MTQYKFVTRQLGGDDNVTTTAELADNETIKPMFELFDADYSTVRKLGLTRSGHWSGYTVFCCDFEIIIQSNAERNYKNLVAMGYFDDRCYLKDEHSIQILDMISDFKKRIQLKQPRKFWPGLLIARVVSLADTRVNYATYRFELGDLVSYVTFGLNKSIRKSHH